MRRSEGGGGRHPLKILITNQFQIKLPIIRLDTPSNPQQTKYPLRTPSRKKPTFGFRHDLRLENCIINKYVEKNCINTRALGTLRSICTT